MHFNMPSRVHFFVVASTHKTDGTENNTMSRMFGFSAGSLRALARLRVPAMIVHAMGAAVVCLAANSSLAACIPTQGLPGSTGVGASETGGRPIGISIEQLVSGQPVVGREAADDAVNGHFVTVNLSQKMWVLAEGDEHDVSRFSINLSTYGDETEQAANWLHAFGVITNAYRTEDPSDASSVTSWFIPFFRQLFAGLDDSTINVTSRVAERGKFKVTAVAMRRPAAVIVCFEPRAGR